MSTTRLSPLVRVVLAPNPSPLTLDGTNTYIVGERNPVVIDPGPDDAGHLQRVLDEAGTVSAILLTHRHPDHAEGAETFAAMARAPLAAFGASRAGACDVTAPLRDGTKIEVDGHDLLTVHTPGHSSDHVSFWLSDEQVLLTGDHVLGRGTTVIAYPDGDLADYMASLERAKRMGAKALYPGHGPPVHDPRALLDYYIAHRREREEQVLATLDGGAVTIADMVEQIYADVDRSLHGAAALSVHAHLHKLARDGVVVEEADGRWRRA